MKKVFFLLMFATMLYTSGVAQDPVVTQTTAVEVSKITKSYCSTPTHAINDVPAIIIYQVCIDDVYYSETVHWDNFCLPIYEDPCILAQTPVPKDRV